MNNENSQIIDFEELFNNDQKNKNAINESKENETKTTKGLLTILLYFLLFFIGIGSLFAGVFSHLIAGKSSDALLVESLKTEKYYTIIPKDSSVLATISSEIIIIDFDSNKLSNKHVILTKNLDEETINWLENNDILSSVIDKDNIIFTYILKTEVGEILKEKTDHLFVAISSRTVLESNIEFFLAYLIVAIPLFLINKKSISDDYFYLKKTHKPLFSKLLNDFAYMLLTTFALGFISTFLKSILNVDGSSANQEAIVERLFGSGGFLVIITTVILAPIVEELVFRKSIFDIIKNQKIALIVSSLSFGLLHITTEVLSIFATGTFNAQALIKTFVFSISYLGMGAFLSYWYYKNKKNITLLIFLHGLSNLFSVIVTFIFS